MSGVPGDGLADGEALRHRDDPFPQRMTFLSPFDRLIDDRERAEDLFHFRYRIEIYTPAAERTYGFYTLPILHGDRLVGRIDSGFDRKSPVLRVNAIHHEPGVRLPHAAVQSTLRSLGEFLGAEQITSAGGWAR